MTKGTVLERKRLNRRLLSFPAGAVLTSVWLKQQGISGRLADYYARSGWLQRVGDGAFTVPSLAPSWLGAVFGLQQKSKTFHPGGLTALELAGLAHFVPLGATYPIYLFSRAGERLPQWFKGLSWTNRVRHIGTNFLPHDLGFRDHHEREFAVSVSAPERAVLEFLHNLTPTEAGYEHAHLLFEGLGTLRPDWVQGLLEACTSVKVKRLFLHLAERHSHAWFKQLELTKVTLGSGKRLFVAGGRLDPKYLITVAAVENPLPNVP